MTAKSMSLEAAQPCSSGGRWRRRGDPSHGSCAAASRRPCSTGEQPIFHAVEDVIRASQQHELEALADAGPSISSSWSSLTMFESCPAYTSSSFTAAIGERVEVARELGARGRLAVEHRRGSAGVLDGDGVHHACAAREELQARQPPLDPVLQRGPRQEPQGVPHPERARAVRPALDVRQSRRPGGSKMPTGVQLVDSEQNPGQREPLRAEALVQESHRVGDVLGRGAPAGLAVAHASEIEAQAVKPPRASRRAASTQMRYGPTWC